MRHHLIVIDTYLKEGKVEEAQEYLQEYYNSLPFSETLVYTQHTAVNAVLSYYQQEAKDYNIPCTIDVSYPETVFVSDNDLTIMIGNLFENAIEASRKALEEDPSFKTNIEIHGNYDGNYITFSIQNDSLFRAEISKNGEFLSSKREGAGVGIDSVNAIVEKNHGTMSIEQPEGKFSVSFMI